MGLRPLQPPLISHAGKPRGPTPGTVDEAALVALSTRKARCDKKSAEQLENERLSKELRGQEKTIAKLSAIVVAQKKISELLKDEDDSD